MALWWMKCGIMYLLSEIEEEGVLAQAIVDTVREPLLVLDQDLRVVAASRSFCTSFDVVSEATLGRLVYELGEGEWNIPALRHLLELIIPEHGVMEDFEVDHVFPRIGHRTLILTARKVFYEGNSHTTLLLCFYDVTERRASERALQFLLEQKDLLLAEMSHRVANSLQIIASILLLKAKTVRSEESRLHLEDAHRRVLSVASVQQHLQAYGVGHEISIASYLTTLCETLSASMISGSRPIALRVVSGEGHANSSTAVSLGLIVTELVMNALKYAFPQDTKRAEVVVGYEANNSDWRLTVSDNGKGLPKRRRGQTITGLGTHLIEALAQQLDAQVKIDSSRAGTTVSVMHATFTPQLPTPTTAQQVPAS
jgi:two-component sensor histidine kinase